MAPPPWENGGGAGEGAEEEEPDGEQEPAGDGRSEMTFELSEEDAGWLGSRNGGGVQARIARAAGCELELIKEKDGTHLLRFSGKERTVRLAKLCARLILESHSSSTERPLLEESEACEDCTLVTIPEEAMAPVTGKSAGTLRSLEDLHGVALCFVHMEGVEEDAEGEDLAILGSVRGRRAAQLAVMGIVEGKVPGFFVQGWRESGDTYENEADLEGDWATATREMTAAQISYAIGKGGSTRRKISLASGCLVTYLGNVAFMSGTRRQRERAQEYIQWLVHQLDGDKAPIKVATQGRKDCTRLLIPRESVAFVTGRHREALCAVEESCGVLTFYVERRPEEDSAGDCEALGIFGPLRSRCQAELQIKSSVETKFPGHFGKGLREIESRAVGFARDHVVVDDGDIPYTLGKGGVTRKKLVAASNAILQFVGSVAVIAGTLVERHRCRDYMSWLLMQKDGKVPVDSSGRDDVTEVLLEEKDGNWLVRGHGNAECRRIEQETGTFVFLAENPEGRERLVICGHDPGAPHSKTGRHRAAQLVEEAVKGSSWKGSGGQSSWSSSSGGRWGDSKGSSWSGSGGQGSSWSGNSWSGAGGASSSSWKDSGNSGSWKSDSYGGKSDSYGGKSDSYGGKSESYGGSGRDRWERSPRSRTPAPPRSRTPAPPQRSRTPAPHRPRTPERHRSRTPARERGSAPPAWRQESHERGGHNGGARSALGWNSRQSQDGERSSRYGTWEPSKDEPVPPWRQKSARGR